MKKGVSRKRSRQSSTDANRYNKNQSNKPANKKGPTKVSTQQETSYHFKTFATQPETVVAYEFPNVENDFMDNESLTDDIVFESYLESLDQEKLQTCLISYDTSDDRLIY